MQSIPQVLNCTGSQVLHHARGGDSTTFVGYLPTKGISKVNLKVIFTMGNAADSTITIKTADDSSGTNATALTANVPIWRDGVRGTDAKAVTESQATGTFVHDLEIPAEILPADKYLGAYADSGNSGNKFTVIALEDHTYKG